MGIVHRHISTIGEVKSKLWPSAYIFLMLHVCANYNQLVKKQPIMLESIHDVNLRKRFQFK